METRIRWVVQEVQLVGEERYKLRAASRFLQVVGFVN
jgi:hypothetical protein